MFGLMKSFGYVIDSLDFFTLKLDKDCVVFDRIVILIWVGLKAGSGEEIFLLGGESGGRIVNFCE